jgi:hypothetical protein
MSEITLLHVILCAVGGVAAGQTLIAGALLVLKRRERQR